MKGTLAYYVHSGTRTFEELKEDFENDKTKVTLSEQDKDQVSVLVEAEIEYEQGQEEAAVDKYTEETAETLEVFSLYDEQGNTILTEEDL